MADVYNIELFFAGMIVGGVLVYSVMDIITKGENDGSDENR